KTLQNRQCIKYLFSPLYVCVGSGTRVKGKGIVEQCCLKPCDLQHLESYCAKPKRSRRRAPLTPQQVKVRKLTSSS
uniref:Insulin-like domain-containing protein n=1 Tax=Esox lucius TaxID=8010 RepID=A0A3P8XPP1_ESOLU